MEVFAAFSILMALTVASDRRLTALKKKNREDWILDSVGLFFQGILIPFLQIAVVYQLYDYLLPSARACLNLPAIVAFFLSFMGVDYLYYWNHRLLHSRWLWPFHLVHHTMTERHVLGTSRNTLWTSFFILYLWIHPLFIYLIQDPTWYIAGVSLTSALDLWRHSEIEPAPGTWIHRLLSPWLILPQEHAWHHANRSDRVNYGANFKLWDRLHGTDYDCEKVPDRLGVETHLTLIQKLVWPFSE